jgi:hypothetical protein
MERIASSGTFRASSPLKVVPSKPITRASSSSWLRAEGNSAMLTWRVDEQAQVTSKMAAPRRPMRLDHDSLLGGHTRSSVNVPIMGILPLRLALPDEPTDGADVAPAAQLMLSGEQMPIMISGLSPREW